MNKTKITATIAANGFKQCGGMVAIVSPGSRNAPLIRSFQNTGFDLRSIVDERSAGFIALGIALATKKPVALICTSGTAVLNYAPAIAESFYTGVCLIVFSADRPEYMLNQGVGQTINQKNVFNNFQKSFFQFPLNVENQTDYNILHKKVVSLIQDAQSSFAAPAHFNLPFEEPLYENEKVDYEIPLVKEQPLQQKVIALTERHISELLSTKKIMILCGVLEKNEDLQESLEYLSGCKPVVVLTEHTSNLQLSNAIRCIDKVLELNNVDLKPEIVITLGENIISKKIKSFISSVPCKHWYVSEDKNSKDTFGKLVEHIKTNPSNFCSALSKLNFSQVNSDYNRAWKSIKDLADQRHKIFLNNCAYSDLSVFKEIINKIPSDYHLQSGNSSIVRYFQLFDKIDAKYFYANRGTSGIDGSTSTAVGYCIGSGQPTLLVSGDLSFMYDSNGLWNNYVSPLLRIIIINNGGGGIFRIIPGPKKVEKFETFFEGAHTMEFKGIVENLGLEYALAANQTELDNQLKTFFSASTKAKVLEIKTPKLHNDKVLEDYFKYIRFGQDEKLG